MRMLTLVALAAVAPLSSVAAPVQYNIDASHTFPSFEAPHMGLSWWRGKINKTTGTATLDTEAQTGSVKVVMDMKTIDFGHDGMNEHAMKEDFLNVAEFPTAAYEGKLMFTGDKPTSVEGMLTLHGVTKPVKLELKEFKCIMHPYFKREACGGDAYGEFNRGDFGVSYGGDGALGLVRLRIQFEALKQ